MFRHWRIQVSLICFTLFLAVIVFWVRSYSWVDKVTGNVKSWSRIAFISDLGDVYFMGWTFAFYDSPSRNMPWRMTSTQLSKQDKDRDYSFQKDHCTCFLGFVVLFLTNEILIGVPYRFISIFFALLCGLPWYWRRFNFSLRTFFIAFTVLAVVLGFAGWVFR